MRIVFKNSKIFFAAAKWSAKGKIIKVDSSEVSKVNLPSNAKVYSRNLVDSTQAMHYKILNDSGAEVTDASSYFKNFIAVDGECILRFNYAVSRVYLYDHNRNLLKRLAAAGFESTIPATVGDKVVAWVQIQTTGGLTVDQLKDMIVVRDEPTAPSAYEAYQSNADGTIYSPYSWVWADDLSEIEITAK